MAPQSLHTGSQGFPLTPTTFQSVSWGAVATVEQNSALTNSDKKDLLGNHIQGIEPCK